MTPFEEADARLGAMHGYEAVTRWLECGRCHTGMRTLGELCPMHRRMAMIGWHAVESTPDA